MIHNSQYGLLVDKFYADPIKLQKSFPVRKRKFLVDDNDTPIKLQKSFPVRKRKFLVDDDDTVTW